MRTRCPICLLELIIDEETLVTPCRHVFHPACLREWLGNSPTCPKCRFQIKPNTVTTLYLEPYTDSPKTLAGDELDMEGYEALEKCMRILLDGGGKTGVMPAKELGKKMGVNRQELDVLLDAYPGCFAQYDMREAVETSDGGSKKRKLAPRQVSDGDRRVVELCPVFTFCWAHAGSKDCVESKCRKLHVCRKFMLDNEDGCKNGTACRLGHSYVSGHNLRIVRKELEFDVNQVSKDLVSDVVAFSLAKHARALGNSSKKTQDTAEAHEEAGERSKAEGADEGLGAQGGRRKANSAPRAKATPRSRAARVANDD